MDLDLQGIVPALTTPFASGAFDPDALRRNVLAFERAGVAGYLVLGSTGETVLLEAEERRLVLDTARAAVPAGRPLIAGVSAESTAAARRGVAQAADAGADAVLLGTPHYFRDLMTGEAIAAHVRDVAADSPLPLLLYNVPKFTGLALPRSAVRDLSRLERVAGIKESSGDRDYLREVQGSAGPGFRVFCGAPGLVLEALAAGAAGAILAAANVLAEPFVRIAALVAAGATSEAERVLGEIAEPARFIAGEHGVPGIKAAMDLRGLAGGAPRPPLRPVSDDVRAEIADRLAALVEREVLPGPRGD